VLYTVPFIGKFIKLHARSWERAAVSCEHNCARIRPEIRTQKMCPRDIAKDTDIVFFTPERSTAPIQGVLLVMSSVLSLEEKIVVKRTI